MGFAKRASATVEKKNINDFFVPSIDIPTIKGFKLGVFGDAGVGKTHLSAHAPGEKFFIDTEGTSTSVINKFDTDLRKTIKIMDVKKKFVNDADIINYSASLTTIEDAIDAIYYYTQGDVENDVPKPPMGTIIIDSGSDVWNWLGFWLSEQTDLARAKSGKMIQTEWQRPNKRHAKILDKLLKTEWNVIITAQAHPQYGDGGQATGINDAKWQKGVPFWCDVSGELKYNNGHATYVIRKCRHDRTLVGQSIEDPTFEKIVQFISDKTGLTFAIE